MKYSIVTFGCRVNQADSLRLEESLRARGASEASSADADVVIVNTCSVTATADQGARQTIRRIARSNPGARVIVTGCYATRSAEVAALPNVVHVVRNDDKARLIDAVADVWGVGTSERFGEGDGACGAAIEPGVAGRSTPIEDVLSEGRRIAGAGFKEIALTGVHLGSYGRDLLPRSSLLALLRALSGLDLDVTFRVSSLEPMDCTPAIVDLIAASGGRIAPHFHLPLQHSSDRMLALMRRPYTLDYYRRLVDAIVGRLPHASIGADMIVGFPGEREEDFDVDLAYLPSSPLTHLHVFPYSDRPGTAASAMMEKVDGLIVRERGRQLREIGAALARRFRASQAGTVRPGLTLEDGTLVVTDNYLKVRIPPGKGRNERVTVRVGEDGGTGELGNW